MKKIGIVTISVGNIINKYNYGNKLQNYALQRFVEKIGYSAETILHETKYPIYTKKMEKKNKIMIFLNPLRLFMKLKQKLYYMLNKQILYYKEESRNKKFIDFNNKYMHYTTKIYNTEEDFRELTDNYDTFITGSDQIWNPYYEGSDKFSYLSFAPKNKRIAYAPSIGINYVPSEIDKQFYKWVDDIKHLSIREENGKKIIENRIQKNAELVCDPVFLLNKDEWNEILDDKKDYSDCFTVYILGNRTNRINNYIKELEKKTGLKALDIYNKYDLNSSFCGPNEFISIISKSKFMVTDSFHGTAFSVIYNKPFVLIDRNASNKNSKYDMSSRINNLLDLINCHDRNIELIMNNMDTLYNCGYDTNNLEILIDKSKRYLKESIKESLKK